LRNPKREREKKFESFPRYESRHTHTHTKREREREREGKKEIMSESAPERSTRP
jgi:hypothetical protein